MMMINAIDLIRDRGVYNEEPLVDSDEMVLGIIYNNLYNILDDFYYFYQYLKLPKNINRKEIKGVFDDKMTISYDKMTPFLEEFKSWKKDQIETINKELEKILLLDLGI